jgi:serine/threonine protein kinase
MAYNLPHTAGQSANYRSTPILHPASNELRKKQTSSEPHDELLEEPRQIRFALVRLVAKRWFDLGSSKVKNMGVASSSASVHDVDDAVCGVPKYKRSCSDLPTSKGCYKDTAANDTNTTTSHSHHQLSLFHYFRRLIRNFGHTKRDSWPSLNQCDTTADEHVAHQTQDTDEYSDDGEPNEDDENDRREFKTIRSITRTSLEDLVLKALYTGNELNPRTCRITHRKEGSFHHCVFFRVKTGDWLEHKYVLKIPAHGTAEHWHAGDAFMLRNEAVLMQHIRHHTECPVPEIIAFDETLNNSIGAPYILMEKIDGMSALDMWQGKMLANPPIDGAEYMNADDPCTVLAELRTNFLKSLAHAMSKLCTLEFTEIGVPVFERPEDDRPVTFGPVWHWHSKLCMQQLTPIGPFKTSRAFLEAGLNNVVDTAVIEGYDHDDQGVLSLKGARKLFEMLLDLAPFDVPRMSPFSEPLDEEEDQTPDSPTKYFVLRHDDLDLQNIIVDEDGNVTSIIDWDGCMTVPRCVGYTSLPTFLRRDWLPNYTMANRPYMTWAIKRYRDIYTGAMAEALEINHSDAKYTKKSAIYQALLAVLYDDENCLGVLGKVLAEVEEFRRVDLKELCFRLGKGWPAAEKALEEKIAELLAP